MLPGHCHPSRFCMKETRIERGKNLHLHQARFLAVEVRKRESDVSWTWIMNPRLTNSCLLPLFVLDSFERMMHLYYRHIPTHMVGFTKEIMLCLQLSSLGHRLQLDGMKSLQSSSYLCRDL